MTVLEIYLSEKLEEVREDLRSSLETQERLKFERDSAWERLKALEKELQRERES